MASFLLDPLRYQNEQPSTSEAGMLSDVNSSKTFLKASESQNLGTRMENFKMPSESALVFSLNAATILSGIVVVVILLVIIRRLLLQSTTLLTKCL